MNNEDWYDNIKETVRRDVANRSHDEEDTIHRMFDGIKTYLSKESSRHINQKYLIALLEEVEIACSKLFSFKSSTSSVHAQPTDESIGYRQGRATLKQKFIEFDDFASPLPLNFQSPEEAFRHLDRHKEERSRSTKSLSKIDSKMELKKKRLSQTNIRANLPHSAPGRPATSLGFLEGEISQEELPSSIISSLKQDFVSKQSQSFVPASSTIDSWPKMSIQHHQTAPLSEFQDLPKRRSYTSMIQKSLVVDDSSPVIPVYSSIQSSKVPADLEKILNYIDVEFSKRKCQADVYDESRYRIFDEALTRVIRTFKSWAPLLKMIQLELQSYVAFLTSECASHLQARDLARLSEAEQRARMVSLRQEMMQQHLEKEAEHAEEVDRLSSEIAALQETEVKLREKVAELRKMDEENIQKNKDINRQHQMVLKMYVKMQKDYQTVMTTTGSQNIEEFLQSYHNMVNINSVWELQNRFQDEKNEILSSKQEVVTKLKEAEVVVEKLSASLKDSTAHAFELITYNDSILFFLPAQFPECESFKFKNGRLHIEDAGSGKTKEATLKAALLCIRSAVNGINERYERAHSLYLETLKQLMLLTRETLPEWTATKMLPGRGGTEDVPAILQADGQVKNRNLAYQDVMAAAVATVEEIASQELEGDKWEILERVALSKGNSKARRSEWAYSFLDALRRYKQQNFWVRMCLRLFEGVVYPQVVRSMRDLFERFKEALKMKDAAVNKRESGRVPRRLFQSVIASFFDPSSKIFCGQVKSPERLKELLRCIEADSRLSYWGVSDKEIQYSKLLGPGKEGESSSFCERFLEQLYEERQEYIKDIVFSVQRSKPFHRDYLLFDEAFFAYRRVDPDAGRELVRSNLEAVMSPNERISVAEFQARMWPMHLYRLTPRSDERVERALRCRSRDLVVALRKIRSFLICLRVVHKISKGR